MYPLPHYLSDKKFCSRGNYFIDNVDRFKTSVEKLRNQHNQQRDDQKRWLLLVNFNGYYSARLQKDIETVCQRGDFPFEELLQNIQRNKPLATKITKENIIEGYNKDILKRPNISYLFLLYLALTENEANDLAGNFKKSEAWKTSKTSHISKENSPRKI